MSVLIALPCYGGAVNEQTTVGLFKLGKELNRHGIDHGLLTLSNESLISRGRSRIANFYVNNTDYDYLFFLDADIGFDPSSFFEIWANRDLNLVSAAYPMKSLPLRYNYDLVHPRNAIRNGILEIQGIGLGFTLISRSVFKRIAAHFPELKYVPTTNASNVSISEREMNNSYHYFLERQINDRFLPEDHSFFSRARECGFRAWLCDSVVLDHTGYYVFEGGNK
jgi:hypothetical protein